MRKQCRLTLFDYCNPDASVIAPDEFTIVEPSTAATRSAGVCLSRYGFHIETANKHARSFSARIRMV
jgi:hypothetical protein